MRRLSFLIVILLIGLFASAVVARAQDATAEPPASDTAVQEQGTADGEVTETDERAGAVESGAVTEGEAAEEVPQGVSTLVLLVGAGAIFMVGMLYAIRSRPASEEETAA